MYKTLQINVTANWGSTGCIAEEIGQTVIANGWDSHIAYGRNMTPCSSDIFRIGTQKDIYTHVFQTRLFDRHGLASKNATKKLIQHIEHINPDIIHLHNIHGYYLNYPTLFEYLSKTDIPVVWTLHDCWAFTGHCAYYDFAGCQRWQTGCYDCPRRKEYPASLFLDRSTQNYADKKKWFTAVKNMTLVPVSKWLAGEVRKSFLGHYPIKVIHNGIDTELFSPCVVDKKSFGLDGKFVVLGVASVWSSRKGLADFIELRRVLPDDCVIVLIGLNQKQIASLPAGIIGISRTNNVHELAEYYSMADVFVNPTWEDNFPTTNLEALACGTPIITYRTGGSVEAVDDATGYVVDKGDIGGFASVIHEIQSVGKNRYSAACRHRAVEQFNKTDRFNEYFELYNNILTNVSIQR